MKTTILAVLVVSSMLSGCVNLPSTDTCDNETKITKSDDGSTIKSSKKNTHDGFGSGTSCNGGVTAAPAYGYGGGYGNPILTPQHVCWSETAVSMVRTELPCHLVR